MTICAPRGYDVFCCQCGEPYWLEPDRCDKCGCQGFQYRKPPPVAADGEQTKKGPDDSSPEAS